MGFLGFNNKDKQDPPSDPRSDNGSSTSFASDGKKNSGISSVLDKNPNSLPNIISQFRNGRLSLGYDEPTYFGFAIDIHSQSTEATNYYNPYTGLRANPLFYLPTWMGSSDDSGLMPVNTGENFTDLNQGAEEACAIQYLNSYTLPLEDTLDERIPNSALLAKAANETVTRPTGPLNRGFYLMEFIKILNAIQEKTPWAFKEVEGLSALWKASRAGTDYKGVELTFVGDETVDLRLTRLAETYRMATYDSFNGRKTLPPNLEKFSMDIYYMDLRFLKDAVDTSIINFGGSSATYDPLFSGQVNFGGIAFRCMGCRFDFSNFMENATAVKGSLGDGGNFQPKIKIIVDRVAPASYFGDRAFGTAGFDNPEDSGLLSLGNALGGALDLGPFTGGINRVISAGRRSLTNILGTPQRLVNDALLGLQRQFESGVDDFLGRNQLSSRPFEEKTLEELVNARKSEPIESDIFPGVDNRTRLPINQDIFPGVDNRKAQPIKRDEFVGNDIRTADPIKKDVFPGNTSQLSGKINKDVFTGDKPILTTINQRKLGGKITSNNPYKP